MTQRLPSAEEARQLANAVEAGAKLFKRSGAPLSREVGRIVEVLRAYASMVEERGCFPASQQALFPPPPRTDAPITHELKCWPDYYAAVVEGRKTFEWRYNDRDFRVGDALWLREWSPLGAEYTGRDSVWTVSYMFAPQVATPYVILALTTPSTEREIES